MTLLIEDAPLEPATPQQMSSDSGAAQYELDRRVYNAKSQMLFSVLADYLASRIQVYDHENTDWDTSYAALLESGPEGNVSEIQLLENEIVGKLGTSVWHENVVKLNRAGLLRERISIQTQRNLMLLKLVRQEEQRGIMEALRVLDQI